MVVLGACANDKGNEKPTNENSAGEDTNLATEKEEDVNIPESEYPFPTDVTPIGNASILVNTPAGDSSDENVPALFVSEDDLLVQIGIDYENFDGSKETFVYINEVFQLTEQVGELSQSSLDLSEWLLAPGEYTVTAVQFEENDPSKSPINLTQAQYKIEKSS